VYICFFGTTYPALSVRLESTGVSGSTGKFCVAAIEQFAFGLDELVLDVPEAPCFGVGVEGGVGVVV